MTYNKKHLDDLNDIKQIMERSSRFISLSGWSGIAAVPVLWLVHFSDKML
jgi:hypothetical protein